MNDSNLNNINKKNISKNNFLNYVLKEKSKFHSDLKKLSYHLEPEEKEIKIVKNQFKVNLNKRRVYDNRLINLNKGSDGFLRQYNELNNLNNERAKSENLRYLKIINENNNYPNSIKEDYKKDYGKFISLGIYAIQLKNINKILYFDIYHRKIHFNYLDNTTCSKFPNIQNLKIFDSSSLDYQVDYDNIIDDYFFYNVTEHIEDKLKILDEINQKEKLFAKLSHEFKTPLNSIVGMITNILELNVNNEFSSKLNTIKNLSNYVIFLISDIIQYSNISKIEDLKLHMTEIKIEEILSFCYQILNSLIYCNKNKKDNINTKLIINDYVKKYLIIGDEFRIKQILLNFISNSVKFTNNGKIYIKCKKVFHNNKKQLKISVKDTGIGIKEEDKKRLFKDYEMLDIDKNLKNNITGSGLGLSICKSLLKKMEMDMLVKSDYLKGSKFSLLIPYKKRNKIKIKEDFSRKSDNQIEENIRFKKKNYDDFIFKDPVIDIVEPPNIDLNRSDKNKKFDIINKNNKFENLDLITNKKDNSSFNRSKSLFNMKFDKGISIEKLLVFQLFFF